MIGRAFSSLLTLLTLGVCGVLVLGEDGAATVRDLGAAAEGPMGELVALGERVLADTLQERR